MKIEETIDSVITIEDIDETLEVEQPNTIDEDAPKKRITNKTHYRRLGREMAMQFLYQLDINLTPYSEEQVELFWTQAIESGEFPLNRIFRRTREYATRLIECALKHQRSADLLIEAAAKNYQLSRIGAVERNILRVAITEFRYLEERIPAPVSINEAVEITKIFADEDSTKFINAVLDTVFNKLTEEPELVEPAVGLAVVENDASEELESNSTPKYVPEEEPVIDFVINSPRLVGEAAPRKRIHQPQEEIVEKEKEKPKRDFSEGRREFGQKERPKRTFDEDSTQDRPKRDFGDRPTRPFGDRPRRDFGDRPDRQFGDRPRRDFGDRPARSFGDRPARPFNSEGGSEDRPRRSFGDRPARPFGDRPKRDFGDRPARSFGDRPKRDFGDRPARSFGDRPARPFNSEGGSEDRPRRSFGDRPARPFGDRPKRDFGDRPARPFGDRPKRDFGDRPARPFGDRPKRDFGDRPARPFGDRPKRDFGDRPARPFGDRPKRDFGDRPARPFGDRPKRDFGDRPARPFGDRPKRDFGDRPKRDFGDKPRRPTSDE